MKMQKCLKILSIAGVFLMVLSLGVVCRASDALPKALAIGTSSLGSSAYVQTVGIANLMQKYLDINVTVEAIGGPNANVQAMKKGKVDLMTGSSLAPAHAFLGVEAYSGKKVPLRLIAQGYFTHRHLIVAPDIKFPPDLKGKVFIGEKPGTIDYRWITDALFGAYGLSPADVRIAPTGSTKESIKAYRFGKVHGFICGGGTPSGSLLKLAREKEFNILSIDDKIKTILAKLPPGFTTHVIPGGTYKGVNGDRLQLALRMGFVCRRDFPEEAVYQITKTFYEHFDEFKVVHKAAKEWNLNETTVNATLAFHPGAVKYYKEAKVWTPEAEKIQKNFLKMAGEGR